MENIWKIKIATAETKEKTIRTILQVAKTAIVKVLETCAEIAKKDIEH